MKYDDMLSKMVAHFTSQYEHGQEFPFDATDEWWSSDDLDDGPPPPIDWAHAAARGIIADIQSREDLCDIFAHSEFDAETRVNMVLTMAAIIRLAYEKGAELENDQTNDKRQNDDGV